MNIRKLVQKRIQQATGGVNLDSDVHAVVAANVGEEGSVTHVSSTQHATSSKPAAQTRDASD